MKFFEKYPILNEREKLINMMVNNLYATMVLENQKVSLAKIRKIVVETIDKKSKGSQVFFN